MATIVLTATGKKTMSATMTEWAKSPLPNHSAMSGASARIGTAWAATRYGESTRFASRERART